ncbi:MAG: hypothetical protein B6U72_04905 [Candidatus Altiarchaeales archaeon ex4484_2]|nr:MAG: hypothetical protein B6U72_04905 [Candidatus Altiarchaeales archaeon ex4484_2]
MISLNLLLFLYMLFPNPVLFMEQIERRSLSLEDMAETDHPLLAEFAEKAYRYNNESPGTYVYEVIEGKRDSEIYLNIDFRAYPHETIQMNAGDCEDLAILALAVCRYTKNKYGSRYESSIVEQPLHFYVIKRDPSTNKTEIRGHMLSDEKLHWYSSLPGRMEAFISQLPLWRWSLYLILALILNHCYYLIIYSREPVQ